MALPQLTFAKPTPGFTTNGITLVVYAPYGSDPELSSYPNATRKTIDKHPLVLNLAAVAACGVHVCALVDLCDDDTYLVEFAANAARPEISSRWKQQMDAVAPLASLLRHARRTRPGTALVLGLEGHGAGYLPDIDRRVLTAAQFTDNGKFEWRLGQARGAPVFDNGNPLLAMGSPLLVMGSPLLPMNHLPMSTWGLGQALKLGLQGHPQQIGVLHFNNCFNMSVEVLHTVAPSVEQAAGYINYNFFTAGAAYPLAFAELKTHGNTASTQQLATWLAQANADVLRKKTHHPTVGGVVNLARMPRVATRLDALAKALITALTQGNTPAQHHAVALKIRAAIRRAQQYDTHMPVKLESPDELTDLCSFANELTSFDVNPVAVQKAAKDLVAALAGVKVYGDNDTPWIAPDVRWNFLRPDLAMNILCPDPELTGLWDWRSPFYLQPDADRARPAVQPHVIDFLKKTAWVAFIIEYHRQEPFSGLRPAMIPSCLRFNRLHNVP